MILTALIFAQNLSLANDSITFLYINGSNNNDEKMRTWFMKGVNGIHPAMKKKFEKSDYINETLLNGRQYKVQPEPKIFFWGGKSYKDLKFVESQLDFSKAISGAAYTVRSMLTAYLHDAIWVSKPQHMLPILDELNDSVKEEYTKGNDVLLYGYSAGTFITYEYMFNKLPYLNTNKLFNKINVSDDMKEFVNANPRKDTCISALEGGKIGTVSADGHLLFDHDENNLKKHYLGLDEATDKYCSPKGALKGVVNFASPLVLFYSDLTDTDYEMTYFNKYMLKYIYENGLFFLTVNFREDPLGFPTTQNLTIEKLEELTDMKFENPTGFMYDNSKVMSMRSCLFVHTSYWKAKKIFPSAVVKTFEKAYKFNYDKKL